MSAASAKNFNPEPPIANVMDAESRRFGRKLGALFLLLSAILAVGGYFFVAHQQAAARVAAYQQLSAIADLKLNQLNNWHDERLSDARFFTHARFVSQDLRRFLDNPDSEAARSAVLDWLKLLKWGDRYYAAMIFDTRLDRLMSIPDSATEPVPSLRRDLDRALQTHDVVMSDLHQDKPNNLIHIDIVFPVFEDPEQRQGAPIAVILLKIDAREFLFPLIQSWPTVSSTAETLLVRRDGNDVLYLNDLRHRPGSALNLRLPLASAKLSAAIVLRGQTNVIEGIDYRGQPIVAAGRMIPGTTWAMISKMDQAEIFAPLRHETLTAIVVLSILLLASFLLFLLLWRQRNTQFLERQLALEKERAALAERVAHLMRNANDIILLLNPEGRVIEANDCALQNYGYTLPEIQQKTLRDLRTQEGLARLDRELEQLKTEGAIFFQTVHQRKDNSTFPVEVSGRMIHVGAETFILSIVRDITERKTHEREIERLNRIYSALSQVNQAVVHAGSRDELLQDVCRVLVQFGGCQMAWIGWLDDATSQVLPLAQFGDEAGYLKSIRVFADDRPEGHGAVGVAVREGHIDVCNDLDRDPRMGPWREAAARSGWRSVAAFPIRQEGRIRGALAVYSQQKDFFGAKEQALLEEATVDVSFGLDKLLNDQRRQEAETSLQALNAELEQRVQQRTADLEAKNKSLEAFAYSVSHDLKSPLRSIIGFSEILVATAANKLEANERQLLEKIAEAADRMNDLIEDLLAYSRLELQAITWSVVDLRGLVEEILEEYQPEIILRQTKVQVEVHCSPLTTDPSGLNQALRNLIGNAVKFSAKATQPTVQITAHETEDACVLEVRDNGIGFDMQFREKIFELFQRLHSNQAYPGTGVGLAIVKRAVTRIGGRVWAESEPGKGAAFFLHIPNRENALAA